MAENVQISKVSTFKALGWLSTKISIIWLGHQTVLESLYKKGSTEYVIPQIHLLQSGLLRSLAFFLSVRPFVHWKYNIIEGVVNQVLNTWALTMYHVCHTS